MTIHHHHHPHLRAVTVANRHPHRHLRHHPPPLPAAEEKVENEDHQAQTQDRQNKPIDARQRGAIKHGWLRVHRGNLLLTVVDVVKIVAKDQFHPHASE